MKNLNEKQSFVSNKDESIRLFKNDFLETLTKVHPVTPLLVFVPVVVYQLYLSFAYYNLDLATAAGFFLEGILIWTLTEYVLHRFVFHIEPVGPKTQRLYFLFHGIHHDYPRDSRRLVMPPSVGIPLSFAIYLLMGRLFAPASMHAVFAGFILGYLCYDMLHYSIHHHHFKNKIWLSIRNHHFRHHYLETERCYGVSSPLWDHVFRTHALEPSRIANAEGELEPKVSP